MSSQLTSAFKNVFWFQLISMDFWRLSNGGEDIVLHDNFGRTIDSVDYKKPSPWPSLELVLENQVVVGASIELIDFLSDNNLGSN